MVESWYLADLASADDDVCLAACRRLQLPKEQLAAAYLKPLFQRIRKETPPEVLACCLEVIHRIVRQGRFAYSGAKRSDMCAHLARVKEVLFTVFGKKDGTPPHNGDLFAAAVLRDYAQRYEYATALLVEAVADERFSLLVGQAPAERVAEHKFIVAPSSWSRLIEIYRESAPREDSASATDSRVVHYGSGCLLAQFAFTNRAIALKTPGLLEELITDRFQRTAETAMRAVILWGSRSQQLVPALETARETFQGVGGVEALTLSALCVAKGRR